MPAQHYAKLPQKKQVDIIQLFEILAFCFLEVTVSALNQPLSLWERFRARYLGAQPQYRVLPKDKQTLLGRFIGTVKCIGKLIIFTPFLPSLIAFTAFQGYSFCSQTMVLIFIWDISAFLITLLPHVYTPRLLNAFGLAVGVMGLLGFVLFTKSDNVYQNICQKLFNKNFKDYPLRNMLKNMEALRRRKNALCLHDKELDFELSFCIQHCEPDTLKSVSMWCDGSYSMLQYRHLEALRAHVLDQCKDFRSYTKKRQVFQGGKNVRIARKEADELLKACAIRIKLENATSTCEPPQRISSRRI